MVNSLPVKKKVGEYHLFGPKFGETTTDGRHKYHGLVMVNIFILVFHRYFLL